MFGAFFGCVIAFLLVGCGFAVRCRGCRRSTESTLQGHETEVARVRLMLVHLEELAARMSQEVDEHSSQMGRIHSDLASIPVPDADKVLSTIQKVIEANTRLKQRLKDAERLLEEQSQVIQAHAVQARTDALTALPNRRAFDDELRRRIAEFRRHGRISAVILADVDHFKKFNDSYGQQVGDSVLSGIASVLRQSMRDMDLVARYGGEEFGIILPGASLEEAALAAERARRAIEQARLHGHEPAFRVTMSFGAAHLLPNDTSSRLIERADQALHASKENRRNCTHVHNGSQVSKYDRDRIIIPSRGPEASSAVPCQAGPGLDNRIAKQDDNGSEPQIRNASLDDSFPLSLEVDLKRYGGDRTTLCQQIRQRIAEWNRGGPWFCLVMAHLENHGEISRRYGEAMADLASRVVLHTMYATVREMDSLGRYDRDRFVVLLPAARTSDGIVIASRMRRAIMECALPVRNHSVRCSVRMGVAEVAEGDDVIRILQRVEASANAPALSLAGGDENELVQEVAWS